MDAGPAINAQTNHLPLFMPYHTTEVHSLGGMSEFRGAEALCPTRSVGQVTTENVVNSLFLKGGK